MIRRDRLSPPPAVLADQRLRALGQLRNYHLSKHIQSRYPLEPDLVQHPMVAAALAELFSGKCAYCESPTPEPFVEWHRPPQEAMDLDRKVARDHYWWLAYDWENLYPICSYCRSNKSTWFPVLGRRAEPEVRGPELLLERALLVDPCVDEPEHLFLYSETGDILGTDERGTTTINILELNRGDLVRGRQDAAREVLAALEPFGLPKGSTSIAVELRRLVADDQPYAGIRRWALRKHFLDRGSGLETLRHYGLDDPIALDLVGGVVASHEPTDYPSEPVTSSGDEQLDTVRLERIDIRNFRAIEHVVLDFRAALPDREPWLLLLGENGVGKSSLLRAVALAMAGEEERVRREPDAGEVVRRGSRAGEVRLGFSDGREVVLRFRQGQATFDLQGDVPALMVLGYGPTRLPPPKGTDRQPTRRVDVDNLFDPWSPLSDAEAWLADVAQVPSDQFNLHATDLKTLLPMEVEDRLLRRSGRLYATSYGERAPLAELSDGYRSVIALAADLILHLASYWQSMATAEGLLLIDELEVHLHPQWRMTIVSLLRRVFPRLRVIATTHDPLSLQQTEPGEVVLLRRTGRTGVEAVPRDVPKGLRADQLLTGDWFGLTTTTDAETAALVDEHSKILLERPSASKQRRRADLEEQLRGRLGQFAETSVERLAQDVAAQIIREEAVELGEAGPAERARIKNSVAQAVRRRTVGQRAGEEES
ncbi:AAA family ATPase [Kribbella sancticallisti]|uniref:AAA family ATPase n=1 Tax=Kribbella sancticallisti TaxID=460087 RepID=A0ABN2D2W1_9ACTN